MNVEGSWAFFVRACIGYVYPCDLHVHRRTKGLKVSLVRYVCMQISDTKAAMIKLEE